MLTIQPKITSYSRPVVTFKAGYDESGDDFYKSKIDYYKKQAAEFDELANNNDSPGGFRKVMKFFAVVAGALLEGWAVAWGASKGAKILKGGIKRGVHSNFAKQTKEVLKPIYNGIKASSKKAVEKGTEIIEKIKTSKLANKLTEFIGKMKENKVGKYVVKAFEYVGKAFKYVGSLIGKAAKKVAEPFKGKPAGEIYDKGAKAASVTLGVGAGAAGAYNAATNAQERKEIYYQDCADGNAEMGE